MSNASSRRGIITGLVAVILAVGVVGGAYWYMTNGTGVPNVANVDDGQNAGVATGDVQVGAAPYALTDMNGQPLTQDSFPGKYKVVFFGFTNCGDVCPIALKNMADALAKLGADAAKVQMIFISVDPARDTPEVLKKYLGNFDARIIGATGTPEQVKQAEDSFRVYASEGEDGDDEDGAPAKPHNDHADMTAMHQHADASGDPAVVNHSDNIYLLSPQNGLLNVFNGDVDGASLAGDIQTVLAAAMIPDGGTPAPDVNTPPSDMAAPDDAATTPPAAPTPAPSK